MQQLRREDRLAGIIVVTILALAAIIALTFFPVRPSTPAVITYDCNLAEISPDFPKEVKEQCRERLASAR